MSGTANVLSTLGEGGRAMFPLARREAPRATWRLPATSQLIAPPCELVLPSLEKVSTEQRFAADDREVIALAEALRQGFRTLAVACDTLAAASRLIDLMPGNDDGVITREEQS
jgi:hypothetical protein